ncbi:hypothetical protein ANN_07480 [Periplaneta americana]|uniref:Uncharacterized protein n=1 Tax=Periplaneta americana TaxID=6978 RepID=A0ABQ8SZE2_PERAM|nr:hypothetical protein ANN_07480 [Periplaneta americana]
MALSPLWFDSLLDTRQTDECGPWRDSVRIPAEFFERHLMQLHKQVVGAGGSPLCGGSVFVCNLDMRDASWTLSALGPRGGVFGRRHTRSVSGEIDVYIAPPVHGESDGDTGDEECYNPDCLTRTLLEAEAEVQHVAMLDTCWRLVSHVADALSAKTRLLKAVPNLHARLRFMTSASVQVEDLAENSSFAGFKFQFGRWRGLCEENGGMYA